MTTLVLALTLFVAAEGDWSSLSQLKAGDRIHVVQTNKTTVSGQFRSSSADNLVIQSDGADQAIPRNSVVRVSLKTNPHRVRNGIILGVVGGLAGAGAMRFGIACAETNDGCTNTKIAAVGGAAGGAAIGALLPGGSTTIYRVKSLPATP
jgi:hypothetical protein